MAIELYIEVEGAPEGLEELFAESVAAALRAEGVKDSLVSIRLVDDGEIRALNRVTRGVDRATDVLSYPTVRYPEGVTAKDAEKLLRREYDPNAGMAYLGDCVISLPRARAQAAEYGHSLRRELGYLAIHSAFHLMGYDHMTDEDKQNMRGMEKQAIRDVRLWRNDDMTDEKLFELACEAMEKAYSPYSNYKVGACILTEDGRTFPGCNFENSSYGATICAERCAAGNAVVGGARRFKSIAVVGGAGVAWPCGVCRQVLNEFGGANLRVIVGEFGKGFTVCTLGELLPKAFGPEDLGIEG